MVIDRVESIGDYSFIDMTQTEVNLERLTDNNQENPNLLLNMLEMALQTSTTSTTTTSGRGVSTDVVHKVFRNIVQSKHIKLLERAESDVLYKYFPNDTNLLRLLIVGYIKAGGHGPERAAKSLLDWTKARGYPIQHQQQQTHDGDNLHATTSSSSSVLGGSRNVSVTLPGIKTYRFVITELSKLREYELANEVLTQLCKQYAAYHQTVKAKTTTSAAGSAAVSSLSSFQLTPDRDFFHRILSACTAPSRESILTAENVLDAMIHHSETYGLDTQPTSSTFHLFIRAWSRAAVAATTSTTTMEMTTAAQIAPSKSALRKQINDDSLASVDRRGCGDGGTSFDYYDYDWVLDTLRRLEQNVYSAKPDVSCWNLVIDVMAERGEYEKATSVLHQMLTDFVKGDTSVRPDNVTVNTVLKAHSVAGTVDAAESATSLLKRLSEFQLIQQQQQQQQQQQDSTAHITADDVTNARNDYENSDSGYDIIGTSDESGSIPSTDRRVTENSHDSSLILTARAYSTVQALWCKLRQPDRAFTVLQDSEKLYNVSMKKLKDRKTRKVLLKQLRPDEIAYNTIVDTLSKVEPPMVQAAELAQRLVTNNMRMMKHKPNSHTCNTVLKCWTRAGHLDEAETFIKTMVSDIGVQPDNVSLNSLIHGHVHCGDSQRALDLLHMMLRDNLQDFGLYSSDDTESINIGNLKATLFGIDSKIELSSIRLPRPNTRTFTAILSALAREGTTEAAKEAEDLLMQMQELNKEPYNFDTCPSVISYNAVLNCWCSVDKAWNKTKQINNDVSAGAMQQAESLLQMMKNLKPDEHPNVVSYNTMIKGYGNSMRKAERCVDEMISRGLQPNQSTYKNLLKVLQRDGSFPTQIEKTAKAIEIQQKYKFGANGLPRRRPPSRSQNRRTSHER
jgi:pentatricopeptide repeat protein